MTRLRRALFASALLIPCLSAAPGTQPTQPSDLERETAALRERLKSLEQRVAELERRLARLDEGDARGRLRIVPRPPEVRPPVVPPPPIDPNRPRLDVRPPLRDRGDGREGWQEREFNGLRYYVVPTEP